MFDIRPIEPRDDAALAAIIRTVMPEFGASGDGFAINDPGSGLDEPRLCASRAAPTSWSSATAWCWAAAASRRWKAATRTTCELRKMYFLPALRGLGAGAAMMTRCLEAARGFGFRRCYLETLCGMDAAMRLYERTGFRRIAGPMGATGHGGCNTFYLLDL